MSAEGSAGTLLRAPARTAYALRAAVCMYRATYAYMHLRGPGSSSAQTRDVVAGFCAGKLPADVRMPCVWLCMMLVTFLSRQYSCPCFSKLYYY